MIFIILALTTWRISYLLTFEEGPYGIFKKIRNQLNRFKLSPLFCFYCTSVWVGFVISFFMSLNLFSTITYAFALSAAAILIDEIVDRF